MSSWQLVFSGIYYRLSARRQIGSLSATFTSWTSSLNLPQKFAMSFPTEHTSPDLSQGMGRLLPNMELGAGRGTHSQFLGTATLVSLEQVFTQYYLFYPIFINNCPGMWKTFWVAMDQCTFSSHIYQRYGPFLVLEGPVNSSTWTGFSLYSSLWGELGFILHSWWSQNLGILDLFYGWDRSRD